MGRGFGDLEAVVMERLWERDHATPVREVFEQMRVDREIAYTTVMSTMDNLFRKGWLTRELEGRAYLYRPKLTRERYGADLMREALDSGGRSDLVLAHFLDQFTADESATLRKVLRRRRPAKRPR